MRQAGADGVIDRAQNVLEEAHAAACGGHDVALDVVAGDLIGEGLSLLREGGRWVRAPEELGRGRHVGKIVMEPQETSSHP